jgi:hypothetical protein
MTNLFFIGPTGGYIFCGKFQGKINPNQVGQNITTTYKPLAETTKREGSLVIREIKSASAIVVEERTNP